MAELASNPAGHPNKMIAMSPSPSSLANSRPAFRVLCAWCEQPIEQARPATGLTGTSHGICAPCARQHFGLDLESLTDRSACAA
jgi:hypothetical protein